MTNDNDNNNTSTKKLSTLGVLLIIFPVVFGFNNSAVAFYKMGYASIIWYIIGSITFFLPLMLIIAEYAFSFKNNEGGIQTWMSKSRGAAFGFITTFVFYFAQLFWMVNFSMTRIWIPLSCGLFGGDTTQNWSLLGFNSSQTIGLLSITFIVIVTFFATKDFSKVSSVARLGGIACMTINAILLLSAILIVMSKLFRGESVFVEPINGIQTFLTPPNAKMNNWVSIIGFMSYATFAYAGSETLGSLASKTKTEKTFSKGIIYSTIVIMIGYSLAIFLWGFVQNSQAINQDSLTNFGNVLYKSMATLGTTVGKAVGLAPEISSQIIGPLFARSAGIAMLLITIGAFFAVIYAPIQAVLKGAPKGLFPEFLNKQNSYGAHQNAMWIQASIVCTIIGIISFGGDSAKALYELIVMMANVAQTCPYVFIFLAFPAFRKNSQLDHSYTVFKSNTTVYLASIAGFCTVLIADFLTIVEPILTNAENSIVKTTAMATGPLLVITIAAIIFNNYRKKSNLQV